VARKTAIFVNTVRGDELNEGRPSFEDHVAARLSASVLRS
jgi:hypothetical protein